MKKITSLLVFCFAATISYSQQETYDLVTYYIPSSWKKEQHANGLQISNGDEKKGTYAVILIFKAVKSHADARKNFDQSWDSLVKGSVNVSAAPQMYPPASENGWEAISGLAPYTDGNSKGVVLQITATGYDKNSTIIIITNTDAYQAALDSFAASISFAKPVVAHAAPTMLNKYTWRSHQNRKDGSGGSAGYSTNTYEFYSNGRYKFSNTTFQYHTPKYYMVDEEGTYTVNGNKIILKPSKSNFHVHQKQKTEPATKSGSFNLQTVPYSFEFVTIYDRLRLVLVPDDGKVTKRDGPFNYYANGQMTKSYLYDAENTGSSLRDFIDSL